MNKSETITELAKAMCKAQAQMGGAVKDSNNPFFKSKYADLGAVIKVVKEPFANNGLSYVQFPIESNGRIGIETMLMHESGEWISNEFTVQLTKQDAQGAGSAISYCRRYGLQSMAGIPTADDDGNAAQFIAPKMISEKQADAITDLCIQKGTKVSDILIAYNVDYLCEIPFDKFNKIFNRLNDKADVTTNA